MSDLFGNHIFGFSHEAAHYYCDTLVFVDLFALTSISTQGYMLATVK